jgi:hypothetical protein
VYAELVRNNVAYVHKIMKGAQPGDLRFQQTARFELQISPKTAKAIGLVVPDEPGPELG